MRALITGGAGFIGSRLTSFLLAAGHEVLVVDDFRLGQPRPAPHERLRVVAASLGTDLAAEAIAEFEQESVFHLAALHHIPYTEAHPGETRDVNVAGTAWLLERLQHSAPRAVVACSSASVYGFGQSPMSEDAPFAPRGVYGQTKVETEALLRSFARANPHVRAAAARLFNVYGPGDRTPHLMPALMGQIRGGGTIRVGNTWPRRDYVHVDDVADALNRLAVGPAGSVAYNVGTGRGTSVAALIGVLAGVAGHPAELRIDPKRVRADDGHLVADPSRLMSETSWRPRVELREGLEWLVGRAA